MPNYSMIISFSEEDNAYLVSVPDLPGCMADGRTPDEAVKNAKVIIQEWIETANMLGREIPEPSFSVMAIQMQYMAEYSICVPEYAV